MATTATIDEAGFCLWHFVLFQSFVKKNRKFQ